MNPWINPIFTSPIDRSLHPSQCPAMELTADSRPVKQVAKVNPKAKAKAKAQNDKMKDAIGRISSNIHMCERCGGKKSNGFWAMIQCLDWLLGWFWMILWWSFQVPQSEGAPQLSLKTASICRMLGCVGLLGWGSLSNLASWLTWQNSCFKVYNNCRDCLAFGIPIQTSARHRLQMTPGRDTIGHLWCNGSFSPLTSMVISMGDFTHDSRLRFLAKLQVLFLVVTVPSANRVS